MYQRSKKQQDTRQIAKHDQQLNLPLAASGLHINEKWPLGASPDGLVSCDSSGKGLCESTYPYKYKDAMLVAALADSSSCLNYDDNGIDFCPGYCSCLFLSRAESVIYNWSEVLWFCCLDYKTHFRSEVLPGTNFWDRMLSRAIPF